MHGAEMDIGTPVESMAGMLMCATMIMAMPSSMSLRNGASSMLLSRARS